MSDKRKLIKSIFFGVLTSLLSGVILMCVSSVAILSIGLPQGSLTDYLMIGIAALSSIAGGFVAAKINKGAGLIVGALTGAAVFLLLTVTGMIKGGDFSALSAIRLAATLTGSAAGGALGIREKRKITI